jgi:uncharacterized protein involved in cysteine biosynthesis
MNIEVHAPSQLALVVGVLAALIALALYFLPGTNVHTAFWLMTTAYVVSALFIVVKT